VGDEEGICDLWRQTLLQAVVDSTSQAGARLYPEAAVRDARRWQAGESYTLAAALSAADIDEGWWRSRAVPALRTRWQAIDGGSCSRPRLCRVRPRQAR